MQRYASKRKEKILKSYRTKFERVIELIFILGAIILGIIIVYNIDNTQIPLSWKIAISTFILLLPLSLYLQAALHVNNMRIEKISKYQQKLREKYKEYYEIHNPTDIELSNIEDNKIEKMIKERANFLLENRDLELYTLYLKAYRNHKEEKEKLGCTLKQEPGNTDLKQEMIRLNGYERRFLNFEIGSYLDEIVHIHMRESSIDFSSYIVPLSFFIFIYLTGFLIIVPLINSVFIQKPVTIIIPIPQSDT